MCNLSVFWGKGVWVWGRVWLGGRTLRNLNYPLCVVCRGVALLIYGFYLHEHLLQPVTASFHFTQFLPAYWMLNHIKDTLVCFTKRFSPEHYSSLSLCKCLVRSKGRCHLKTLAKKPFLLKLILIFDPLCIVFMSLCNIIEYISYWNGKVSSTTE